MNSKPAYFPFLGYQRRPNWGWFCFIILLLMALLNWSDNRDSSQKSKRIIWESGDIAFVKRVVDGDTLLLADGTRVRLLGVDTPETKHPEILPQPFGLEAEQFTRKHVEGQSVVLTLDRERLDRFGRLLAYVHKEKWFLNEELIRAGLSKAEIKFSYSSLKKKQFLRAQKEAQKNKAGIWKSQISVSK